MAGRGELRRAAGTLGLNSTLYRSRRHLALIDSGLEPSPDFTGRIKAFYDFHAAGRVGGASTDTARTAHRGADWSGRQAVRRRGLHGRAAGVNFVV